VAVRKSKAMASVTEAKVADAAGPVADVAAKVTEAGPTRVAPAAVEVSAPAAPEEAMAAAPAPASIPAAPQAGTIEAVPAQMREAVEKTMDQATKSAEGLFKAAEEAAEFGRGNLEAVAKATQVYVAGVQDLGKQTLAMVQGLADHTVAGAKALGTVKSLKEAAEIQATYARAALEKSFSETAKLQEAALKLAEASFAPISARMTLAVEKFSKPLAA
jgi:phasin family protein